MMSTTLLFLLFALKLHICIAEDGVSCSTKITKGNIHDVTCQDFNSNNEFVLEKKMQEE